jgi:hypothetical protein
LAFEPKGRPAQPTSKSAISENAKGRAMIISLTALYIAGTVTLIIAGFVAAAVQD